jgi:hypothetical protein
VNKRDLIFPHAIYCPDCRKGTKRGKLRCRYETLKNRIGYRFGRVPF